jgi:ATP-dependent DNA helicase UvrD/PcrA
MDATSYPQLRGQAARAVRHRGSHVQIIASAGSGKTEVVAQRIATIFEEGTAPNGVVAFTFTERAANELKARIERRVSARLGAGFLDQLNQFFVGTIHSYCFQLLQRHVPEFEAYDVLDEHRLAAFVTRYSEQIGIKQLDRKLFTALGQFLSNIDVVENELVDASDLSNPFKKVVKRYYEVLEEHRFLTYGQQIARAVRALDDPSVLKEVHEPLRHLVVDEYQDINPAQEALIATLARSPVELCVVGDDDQSIYQWRGSDVQNIVKFTKRYPKVARFTIDVNRRSRPAIVRTANRFATTIKGRLPKLMRENRPRAGTAATCWAAATESEEASKIATAISSLNSQGYRFKDVAVLVRSASCYPRIIEAFTAQGIPVLPGGRVGLFMEPEALLFGRTFAYLGDIGWGRRALRVGPTSRSA